MENPYTDTALLIFARSARAEVDYKNLTTENALSNFKAAEFLNQKTLSLAESSDLHYFVVDERSQKGITFGEKLSNAIQHVFEKGFQHVITIGNDCPELDAADIIRTSALLHETKSVLGPDRRGGTYLIGLSKSTFDSTAFANLKWQSRETYKDLKDYLKDCVCLKAKNDWNKAIDVFKILRSSLRKSVKRVVQHIAGLLHVYSFSFFTRVLYTSHLTLRLLRAPPTYNYLTLYVG